MSNRPGPDNGYQMPGATTEVIGLALLGLVAIAFGLLVLVTPWAYGGVESWCRAAIYLVLAVVMVPVAVTSLLCHPTIRPLGTLAMILPLLLLLALSAAQWLGGVPALGGDEAWPPQSIYPGASRLAMFGVMAGLAAAFLGAVVFSRDGFFTGLLVAGLVAGATVGFFGIGMKLSGADQVIRETAVVGTPFAKFINRNNAAAFMLVGLSCGIALLTLLIRTRDRATPFTGRASGGKGLDRQTLLIVVSVLTAFPLAGIFASASRGGTIAAVLTLLVGIGMLGRQIRWRWAVLLVSAICLAGGLVVWLGLSERTIARFEAISRKQVLSTGRIPHWIDAGNSILARPLFGAGLGTYGYAYQAHSQRDAVGWFQHADNEYVELLVEMGAAGAACLMLGWGVIAWALFHSRHQPVARTLLATLTVGQLAHAVFDFGIAIPATALLAAALAAAAIVRIVARSEDAGPWGSGRPPWWMLWRMMLATGALLLGGGMVSGALAYQSAWRVDQQRMAPGFTERPGVFKGDELDRKIEQLEKVLAGRPGDAEGHRLLAKLYFYRFRMAWSAQLLKQDPKLDQRDVWERTTPEEFYRRLNAAADIALSPVVDEVRQVDVVQRDLVPALENYQAAASASPSLTGIRIPLQSLAFLEPNGSIRNTQQIQIAARLFPSDSALMSTMAEIAWSCHDQKTAGRCWRNALTVSSQDFDVILERISQELGRHEAVDLLWPEATRVPRDLAVAASRLADRELRQLVGSRLWKYSRSMPASDQRKLAGACGQWLMGQGVSAIKVFQRFLVENPGNVEVRVEFAHLLWSAGKPAPAREQLKRAIWLDPGNEDLRRLMVNWRAAKARARSGR